MSDQPIITMRAGSATTEKWSAGVGIGMVKRTHQNATAPSFLPVMTIPVGSVPMEPLPAAEPPNPLLPMWNGGPQPFPESTLSGRSPTLCPC